MIRSGDLLAVIPARGGSKSIPRKNIQPVAGHPLIAWTIKAAKESACCGRVITTTDSEEIGEVARRYDCEVPFLRPRDLAGDSTPGIDPLLHAVSWLEERECYRPLYVMLLQPTSPLRNAGDIVGAVRLAEEREADAVVSVCPVKHHPYWMKKLENDGRLSDLMPLTGSYTDRQSLPAVYALNGAIYLIRRDVLLVKKDWYTDKTYAYVMPPERSLDVDTSWDLYLADLILRDRARSGI